MLNLFTVASWVTRSRNNHHADESLLKSVTAVRVDEIDEEFAQKWLKAADELDAVTDEDDEVNLAIVTQLRECAHELLDAFGLIDTEGSASRQHYIETGRYLRHDEEV